MSRASTGSLTINGNPDSVSDDPFIPGELCPHGYWRVMSSEPFKIVCSFRTQANENKKQEFFIHSNLLASLSAPLSALVNGGMREAQEKSVTWEVNKDIVLCFLEFAYTGYYSAGSYSMDYWEDVLKPEVIGTVDAARLREILGQSVLHMEVMIFADYHGIELLYALAVDHLERLSGSRGSNLVTADARARVISQLGPLHAPVHVMRDVLKIMVRNPHLLWEKQDFRSTLRAWPDLQSEFLDNVMAKMAKEAC